MTFLKLIREESNSRKELYMFSIGLGEVVIFNVVFVILCYIIISVE